MTRSENSCGVCGVSQGYCEEQTIYPIVDVKTGTYVYRCGEHQNVPAQKDEAKAFVVTH